MTTQTGDDTRWLAGHEGLHLFFFFLYIKDFFLKKEENKKKKNPFKKDRGERERERDYGFLEMRRVLEVA